MSVLPPKCNCRNESQPYSRMNISNKNKPTTETFYDLKEPQKHYFRWKKPDADDQIVYDSICIKCTEKSNVKRLYILVAAGAEGQ